jgi:hypothetical protein
MAIEKPMTPIPSFDDFEEEAAISIEVKNPEAVSVETEDGGNR